MNKLVLTDIHLTDNILDSYRWKIFDTLVALCNKYNIKELILLGDITEKKNNHEARLVNAMIDHIGYLIKSTKLNNLIILCGNHDYIDISNPFFKFLNFILSTLTEQCNVYFIDAPTKIKEDLYIPHYYNDFKEISNKYSFCDNLFLHHSFNGIKLRNGIYEDNSNDINNLNYIKFNNCYSGHIHLAQSYKNVDYIGSPYATKFGDENKGRVLLIIGDKKEYINLPIYVKKIDVKITNKEEIQKYDIKKDDQVKVEIALTLQNSYEYSDIVKDIKKYVEEKDAILISIQGKVLQESKTNDKSDVKNTSKLNNIDIIKRFCRAKQLSNTFLFAAYNALNEFDYNKN